MTDLRDHLHALPATDPGAPPRTNPPGLEAIAYRLGTWPELFRRMRARLATLALPDGPYTGRRPLQSLADQDASDPAVALLDAWALAGDVLTFYQERFANEHYLRTAGDRRSLLELARLTGQELSPGVAASAFLAFLVEDAPEAPTRVNVPAGTQVRSIPGQDQLPQTFETRSPLVAVRDWNVLQPRLSEPPALKAGTLAAGELWLDGLATQLEGGSRLVFEVAGEAEGEVLAARTAVVKKVVPDTERELTRVELDEPLALGEGTGLRGEELFRALRIHALRERASAFGHDAPRYQDLQPPEVKITYGDVKLDEDDDDDDTVRWPVEVAHESRDLSDDPANWDLGRTVWTDSAGVLRSDGSDPERPALYLDRGVDGLVAGGWVMLAGPLRTADGLGARTTAIYRVGAVAEDTVIDYSLSATATGLALTRVDGEPLPATLAERPAFDHRSTRIWLKSEELNLVEVPIEAPYPSSAADADGRAILLDRAVEGIKPGQPIALQGTLSAGPNRGQSFAAVALLQSVETVGDSSRLVFLDPIARQPLERSSLVLNANVVLATHGETVEEALGSGDAELANQSFVLRQPPLTYLSAPVAGGASSTLEVRVDGVLWREVPTLVAEDGESRAYEIRIDQDGNPTVRFGDGIHGARLPTGQENVTARYRKGLGPDGEVEAGSLSLLTTRPLGISEVANPLPATGAAPPDDVERARRTGPILARTLGRLVAPRDYEDFARTFAGIARARVKRIGGLYLTVAGVGGNAVERGTSLYTNLVRAFDERRLPGPPVTVGSYQRLAFAVAARLVIAGGYRVDRVLDAAGDALAAAFAFDRRDFDQPVFASQVIDVLQDTAGVEAVTLDVLALEGAPRQCNHRLDPLPARWQGDEILPAQILVLDPAGILLGERTP